MADRPEYGTEPIQLLTFREAVQRRPAFYFGDGPPADRPLVMAAWLAQQLLEFAVGDPPQVNIMFHRSGELSAIVHHARLTRSAHGRALTIDELLRRRLWCTELARSCIIQVRQDGTEPADPLRLGDNLVWDGLDITVRLEIDADVTGAAPEDWWTDCHVRMLQLFAKGEYRLKLSETVAITHDAIHTTVTAA